MNEKQKVFRRYLLKGVEGHHGDMVQALVWCGNHFTKLNDSQRNAINKLSAKERNQVIHELTMG